MELNVLHQFAPLTSTFHTLWCVYLVLVGSHTWTKMLAAYWNGWLIVLGGSSYWWLIVMGGTSSGHLRCCFLQRQWPRDHCFRHRVFEHAQHVNTWLGELLSVSCFLIPNLLSKNAKPSKCCIWQNLSRFKVWLTHPPTILTIVSAAYLKTCKTSKRWVSQVSFVYQHPLRVPIRAYWHPHL